MSVASILSGKSVDVVTASADQSIGEAIRLLAEHRIGAVVVADDAGGVAGILSERDIVRGLAETGSTILTQPVSSLMTSTVESCTREDTVESVMRKMTDGRFRHMPVKEGDRLVGVISIGDVVKDRMKALEHEAEALRGYVMS